MPVIQLTGEFGLQRPGRGLPARSKRRARRTSAGGASAEPAGLDLDDQMGSKGNSSLVPSDGALNRLGHARAARVRRRLMRYSTSPAQAELRGRAAVDCSASLSSCARACAPVVPDHELLWMPLPSSESLRRYASRGLGVDGTAICVQPRGVKVAISKRVCGRRGGIDDARFHCCYQSWTSTCLGEEPRAASLCYRSPLVSRQPGQLAERRIRHVRVLALAPEYACGGGIVPAPGRHRSGME